MRRFFLAVLLSIGAITQALAAPAYLVREKDGRAAYLDLNRGIWHETTRAVSSLPNASDRALLRCGIPAQSDAELARILEDFCS